MGIPVWWPRAKIVWNGHSQVSGLRHGFDNVASESTVKPCISEHFGCEKICPAMWVVRMIEYVYSVMNINDLSDLH